MQADKIYMKLTEADKKLTTPVSFFLVVDWVYVRS